MAKPAKYFYQNEEGSSYVDALPVLSLLPSQIESDEEDQGRSKDSILTTPHFSESKQIIREKAWRVEERVESSPCLCLFCLNCGRPANSPLKNWLNPFT